MPITVQLKVPGCAWCHFAQRVEDSGDNVKLYCGVAVDRQILPKGATPSTPLRDIYRFYPNAYGLLDGPTEDEAYGIAPDWCPLRQGPISIELASD